MFKRKYSLALETIIGRKLKPSDGCGLGALRACEKRLKLHLPRAIREYYEFAGRLPINTEHNILYDPKQLRIWNGKLFFMEENQRVVFWGVDWNDFKEGDPTVFQANNAEPIEWRRLEKPFSEFILLQWSWLRGLDTPSASS